MNLEAFVSETIDGPWLQVRSVRVGRVPPGQGTPGFFVRVLQAGSPILCVLGYGDGALSLVWREYVVVGTDNCVHLIDPRDDSVSAIQLDSRLCSFCPTERYLLLASRSELVRVSSSRTIVWRAANLGIDGVIVDSASETQIVGQGEWNPPGDWREFMVDAATGRPTRPLCQGRADGWWSRVRRRIHRSRRTVRSLDALPARAIFDIEVQAIPEFLSRLVAHMKGDALMSMEGDLRRCVFDDVEGHKTESVPPLEAHGSWGADFVVIPLNETTRRRVLEALPSWIAQPEGVCHVEIAQDGVTLFGSYDGLESAWLDARVGEGILPALLDEGIVLKYKLDEASGED